MAADTFWLVISQLLGWLYTLSWSISFYPQIWLNYTRKSCHGFSYDFVVYNVYGFLCLTIYTSTLYWNESVRAEYRARHAGETPLVQWNDVVFSWHVLFLSLVLVAQGILYENTSSASGVTAGAQQESCAALGSVEEEQAILFPQEPNSEFPETHSAKTFAPTPVVQEPLLFSPVPATAQMPPIFDSSEPRLPWWRKISLLSLVTIIGSLFGVLVYLLLIAVHIATWLDLIYYISYIKLAAVFLKCGPQIYLNYQLQSTSGYSIWNVLLDTTGGLLSILQLFVDAHRLDNWSGVLGNPLKLFLGVISLAIDVVFLLQHYVWYPETRATRGRGGYAEIQISVQGSEEDLEEDKEEEGEEGEEEERGLGNSMDPIQR